MPTALTAVRVRARLLVALCAVLAVLAATVLLTQRGASAAGGAVHCATVAKAAGFSKSHAVTGVAVAMAESSCRDDAVNTNPPTTGCPNGSTDRGLWQINSCYHPEVSRSCAYAGACNARAAYRISSSGTDWRPWSTYNSGSYRRWLPTAQSAVNSVYGGGSTSAWPTVSRGATGETVRTVQLLLRAHGYSLTADGDFGPVTAAKVRAFQSAHHLAVDGVVGPQTWPVLIVEARRGSRGAAVTALQRELNRHGANLAVDGDFGPATRSAVRSYQSAHHLAVDGVVGPQTWSSLV